MSYSFQDIFNKWAKPIASDPDIRYKHTPREEILDDLVVALKAHEIDYDEAKSRKDTVIKFLTTEEGRKGKGKHKGWVNTIEEQYLGALAFYYIEDKEIPKAEPVEEIEIYPIITNWSKGFFGEYWTEEINIECHRKGSHFNMLFQKEMFDKVS
jgi:hypothetical protein